MQSSKSIFKTYWEGLLYTQPIICIGNWLLIWKFRFFLQTITTEEHFSVLKLSAFGPNSAPTEVSRNIAIDLNICRIGLLQRNIFLFIKECFRIEIAVSLTRCLDTANDCHLTSYVLSIILKHFT